jgi:group I intron endonuclease
MKAPDNYFGFVYMWENQCNGKRYIGSHAGTTDDGYIGSGSVFKEAVKKYGITQFQRVILEFVEEANRDFLLQREKFWIDVHDAAESRDFYNVSKDVIGGDTKAGWSEDRRSEFKNRIVQIWATRSDDERSRILAPTQSIFTKYVQDPNNKEKLRAHWLNVKDKLLAGNARRTTEERRASSLKVQVDPETRRQRALLGAASITKEKRKLMVDAAKKTMAEWSDERKKAHQDTRARVSLEHSKEMSGGKNPKAKRISIDGVIYETLADARNKLSVSEYVLNKRLNSSQYPTWFLICKNDNLC